MNMYFSIRCREVKRESGESPGRSRHCNRG